MRRRCRHRPDDSVYNHKIVYKALHRSAVVMMLAKNVVLVSPPCPPPCFSSLFSLSCVHVPVCFILVSALWDGEIGRGSREGNREGKRGRAREETKGKEWGRRKGWEGNGEKTGRGRGE